MTESSSDWQTLIALFEKVSRLPDYERKEHLKSLQLSDHLRDGLEKMLGTLDHTVSWIDMPLTSRIQLDNQWFADQWTGKQIDGFLLGELLHEGVITAVFKATQDEPVQRDVVIKLVRPDAPKQYLNLFRFEQQALARQAHPNVVKIHDVGSSSDGLTYIAMEYIEGIALADYCDSNELTIVERLKLFLLICEAVTYSHQKGILHRDLKSSNVLVREFADKPSPTIIDYGISTALDEIFDGPNGQLLGTPEYMSPEHVLNPNDMDSRADVYSLGMVLFNLLVGTIPFNRGAISAADHNQIVSYIAEFQTPSPSSFYDDLKDDDRSSLAVRRGMASATSLRRKLDRELDVIFSKATDKDKQLRYQSVAELSGDIRRYLTNQAVTAHPNSAWYQSKKFLSRHFVVCSAIFIVMVLASAFMVKLIDQNLEIKKEILQTQLQKNNAQQVASILAETIEFANPSNAASEGKATVKGMLDYGYRNLQNTLGISTDVKAELMLAFSSGFRGLGDIERAKQIHSSLLSNSELQSHQTMVQTYLTIAQTAELQADSIAQLDYAKKAYDYAVANKLTGRPLVQSKLALGNAHRAIGEWVAAGEHLEQALLLYNYQSLDDDQFLAEILFALGRAAYWQDKYDQADTRYQQASEIVSKYYSDEHPSAIQIELAQIGLANHLQKYQESIPRAEKLYQKAVNLWGQESSQAFAILTELTISYMHNGKHVKAAQAATKNLAILAKMETVPGERTVFTSTLLSNIYFFDGQYEKSFDASLRAYELVKKTGEEAAQLSLWRISETELVHARSLAIKGDLQEALSAYSSGIDVFSSDEFRSNDFLSSALTARSLIHVRLSSYDQAFSDASEGVAIAKLTYPEEDARIGVAEVVKLYTGLRINWSDEAFTELKLGWRNHVAANSKVLNAPQFKMIEEFILAKR